jgi:predicted nucleotide-binding protein (sugar kinase/HSP70/actin superfamily)
MLPDAHVILSANLRDYHSLPAAPSRDRAGIGPWSGRYRAVVGPGSVAPTGRFVDKNFRVIMITGGGVRDSFIHMSQERGPVIGIPRVLYYYYFPEVWEVFFRELGLGTHTSQPSTLATVKKAGMISEAENCLPTKLLDAHLAELVDKADFLLVPRILSTLKGHASCPKLGVLPDTVFALFGDKARILTVEINLEENSLAKSLLALGRQLGFSKRLIQPAIDRALGAMEAFYEKENRRREGLKKPRILLLAHPYLLFDQFFTGPIESKLNELEVGVEYFSYAGREIKTSFIKWDTCNEMYHRLRELSREEYAGVIQISSFNCGCDSMTAEFFRETLQEKRVPFLTLMVDEHTAQGGMDTRLEAFIESMRW